MGRFIIIISRYQQFLISHNIVHEIAVICPELIIMIIMQWVKISENRTCQKHMKVYFNFYIPSPLSPPSRLANTHSYN